MTVFAGDPINASDVNGIVDLLPVTYTKASSTGRNTTTTYAADPELTGIALAVGIYEIELVAFFTLATTNTQKIKTRWIFSGTWNTPIRACIGPANANVGAPNAVTDATMGGFVADSQDAIYDTSTSGSYSVFREVARNVTVTVAGTLALHWAQSVSSANNTNLQSGTSFVIRKIS